MQESNLLCRWKSIGSLNELQLVILSSLKNRDREKENKLAKPVLHKFFSDSFHFHHFPYFKVITGLRLQKERNIRRKKTLYILLYFCHTEFGFYINFWGSLKDLPFLAFKDVKDVNHKSKINIYLWLLSKRISLE